MNQLLKLLKLIIMESKHTNKGAWYIYGNDWIYSGKTCIATIQDTGLKEETKANAEIICKSVNAHDELVKALEDILNHNMVNGNYADTCSAMMSIANNAIKKLNQTTNEKSI